METIYTALFIPHNGEPLLFAAITKDKLETKVIQHAGAVARRPIKDFTEACDLLCECMCSDVTLEEHPQ